MSYHFWEQANYDINYDHKWQLAAEYLDEQLGREATDEEIEEFMAWQEARAMDAFEYTGDE